jgi:hypothetical protein
MTSEIAPRTQDSLVSRPQRLGILPTWWFWNDWERQRLLLPLMLVTAIPLGPLLVVGAIKLQLSIWLLQSLLFVVYPILLMGLVERHVRRQLAVRPVSPEMLDVPPERRHSARIRWVPVALAALNLTALIGVLTGSIWMALLSAASGILLMLVLRPVRGILSRLGRSRQHAALDKGHTR